MNLLSPHALQLVLSNKNHANLYALHKPITCMIPTKRVRVLAINTLAASLAAKSITVVFRAVPLLLDMIKCSSGAMLRTTDPTIKLTTGTGPGGKVSYQFIIHHKYLASTCTQSYSLAGSPGSPWTSSFSSDCTMGAGSPKTQSQSGELRAGRTTVGTDFFLFHFSLVQSLYPESPVEDTLAPTLFSSSA